MFDLLPSVVSDLIAGLAASGIVAGGAVFARRVARGTAQRFANWLGWPAVASAFFGVPLLLTLIDERWVQAAIVLGVQLTVTAPIMLLRFGPEGLHLSLPGVIQPLVRFIRAYPWRTLTTVFLLITIVLLALNLRPDGLKGRVVFVVALDDTELLVLRDILDQLEPELGAEVFLMNIDPSRLVARLDSMVAAAAGEEEEANPVKWDLVAVDNNKLGLLAAKELVQELPAEELVNLYPASLMISLRPLRAFEGTFYFVPFRPNVKIAFYNEAKLAEEGLEPPQSWDDLLETAKNGGRVAIQGHPGPAAAVTLFEFVRAAGGDPLTLDDDGSREAIRFLKELAPYIPGSRTVQFDTANELLIDDQVYLVDNWTFAIKVVVEDFGKEEIKANSGWSGPEQESHVLGGDVLAVPKGAPNADLAVRLIELLVSKENQKAMRDKLTWMPVRLDAYDGVDPRLDPYFEAVRNAFARAEIRPTIPQWPLVEDCLNGAFQALIVEGGDIGSLAEWSSILKEISSIQYVGHRVEEGDSFESVASRYDTTPDVLAEVNRTTTQASLADGQILLVLPELQETCSDVPSST